MLNSLDYSSRLRSDSRRGVTLLEVLVAIGVMVVGLLGMLALIPLGRMELVEAEKLDNSATIGRWAFRDVTVRGYLQPENWVNPVTGGSVFGPAEDPTAGYSTSLTPGVKTREFAIAGAMTPPIAPIVIDPLMLTPRRFPATSDEASQRQICKLFPYSLSLSGAVSGMPEANADRPKMARVSLRAFPSEVITSSPTDLKLMMRADIASRYFRSSDDLNFDVPVDTSKRPIQIYSRSSVSTQTIYTNDGYINSLQPVTNIATRSFRGAYSWFMVVEPNLAEFYSPAAANSPALGGPSASAVSIRQYRVWVVVCHQRPLNAVNGQTLSQAEAVSERLVYVDFVDRNTARLRVGGINNEGDALNALNVKSNQWIGVVGFYDEPLVAGGVRYIMEWYRITGVAERPSHLSGTQWYREVTLVGRDFGGLGFEFKNAGPPPDYPDMQVTLGGSSSQPNLATGFGVIVSGVRGVYEKSIYVDRPSLYSIRH
jgi:hypothetical protein